MAAPGGPRRRRGSASPPWATPTATRATRPPARRSWSTAAPPSPSAASPWTCWRSTCPAQPDAAVGDPVILWGQGLPAERVAESPAPSPTSCSAASPAGSMSRCATIPETFVLACWKRAGGFGHVRISTSWASTAARAAAARLYVAARGSAPARRPPAGRPRDPGLARHRPLAQAPELQFGQQEAEIEAARPPHARATRHRGARPRRPGRDARPCTATPPPSWPNSPPCATPRRSSSAATGHSRLHELLFGSMLLRAGAQGYGAGDAGAVRGALAHRLP